MRSSIIVAQRLLAIFLLGALLFNYPILSLFNLSAMVAGIPVLFLYLFAAWAVVIFLAAVAIERRSD